jgi:hypothetical protein
MSHFEHTKKYLPPLWAALLCMSTTVTLGKDMPADWPDLKPGMTTIETAIPGKPSSKLSVCITQADKDAAIKAADEFARSRKECDPLVYSKRGNTFMADQLCKPAGETAYTEHTEATTLTPQQVRIKHHRLINGKETMLMEAVHTRTGDCTNKEAPQAGSLEAMIEKARAEAAAKGKKH